MTLDFRLKLKESRYKQRGWSQVLQNGQFKSDHLQNSRALLSSVRMGIFSSLNLCTQCSDKLFGDEGKYYFKKSSQSDVHQVEAVSTEQLYKDFHNCFFLFYEMSVSKSPSSTSDLIAIIIIMMIITDNVILWIVSKYMFKMWGKSGLNFFGFICQHLDYDHHYHNHQCGERDAGTQD